MIKKVFLFLFLPILFSGCTQETIGEIGGGTVGALIGSQIGGGSGRMVATVVGAISGSKLGGYLGKKIDAVEEKRIQQAANIALKDNQSVEWENEKHVFKVRPLPRNNTRQKKVLILMKEKGGSFKETIVRIRENTDGTYSLIENS